MKARINIHNRLSNREKSVAKEYIKLETTNIMRRYFKIMCVSLNEKYGFGKDRLNRLIDEISKISLEHAEDEEFWCHIDKRVIEQIGVNFEEEKQ